MDKKQIVITGGKAYTDIDVLASAMAYQQLLTLLGHEAVAVLKAPWNLTIPFSIRRWPIKFENEWTRSPNNCQFVLVDISDPTFMEDFVVLDQVIELFDHHFGHEKFWQNRLPSSAHIEHVGACATLIWEQFKAHKKERLITELNANLLYTAIFANTLNFKSHVTHQRDHIAAEELTDYIHLPRNWKSQYYMEVTNGFNSDLTHHLQNDTKTIMLDETPFYFGQIEVWNAHPIVKNFSQKFTPDKPNAEWLVNIASIEEGRSYLYCNSHRLKNKLNNIVLGEDLSTSFLITPRIWLRKELLKEFQTIKHP